MIDVTPTLSSGEPVTSAKARSGGPDVRTPLLPGIIIITISIITTIINVSVITNLIIFIITIITVAGKSRQLRVGNVLREAGGGHLFFVACLVWYNLYIYIYIYRERERER